MEYFIGQMVESMKEDGKMVSNMVSEPTLRLVVKQKTENGKKVKGFTGYEINETNF